MTKQPNPILNLIILIHKFYSLFITINLFLLNLKFIIKLHQFAFSKFKLIPQKFIILVILDGR